ncbi:CaiB/BaiF CoA transferase family protein [Pseudoroseomonas cervicalis]|uniref:CoA-transferase family III protein n=1 Tax=Pseudoroseomonas cervicalis ATCC 49957 TaxID=525371 RepID=D5RN74_9PROT|nr:CoA transferase [Pseudoroseomonas cervicalis]EFH11256.1 CoA-transferase family III protein [Pseudoroseomonas cervicalis ATCC 49957]
MTDTAPTPPRLARKSFDPEARGALDGVRVLDLARLVAGNTLSMVLADHGAEVVKVEPPEGDTLRAWKVRGVETSWKSWCRNKKSICLDLRSEEGQGVVRALVREAAMLTESFRPGVLEAMGLSPEALLAINPALVIVRISGWGQDGPYRHKPGFGTLVEGYSGFAAVNGFADREPVLPPMFMGDCYAGLYGAATAMIALRHAERTGQGQVIDLSLIDPMLAVMDPQAANYRLTGQVKQRTGSRSTNTAPRNAYRCRDGGWVCLSSSTQGMTEKLLRSIGRPELIEDPRFRTNPDRLRHWQELDAIIGDFIGARDKREVLAHFDAAGVTIGPIMDAADLLQDEYVAAREALIEVPDEDMPDGHVPMHGMVTRLSATPGILARPAPKLGEHNEAILRPALGEDAYARLAAQGIIRGGA